MNELIRLVHFGAPMIQQQYKELCESIEIPFDQFQMKLIEDTGYSYDELKEFWIFGEEISLTNDQIEKLDIKYIPKYLIIHFDPGEKEILGIAISDYECLSDGYDYYEEISK